MIKKAKIHTREIPYFELLNPNFTFDCDFRRIDLKSLIFFQEPPEKYSGYLSFIGQQDVSRIFSSEAAKLRFGDGETVRITSFNFDGKMLSVGYMPSRYSIYKGFQIIKNKADGAEGLSDGRVGERSLSNHCGAGIFINCKRGGEGADADERVLIGMRPNPAIIDTHRLFRTYSASGSVDLSDRSPFETIKRETLEEINLNIDIQDIELISFGYDNQLGYFQFSFYYKTDMFFNEILNAAGEARDLFEYESLDLITYSVKDLDRAVSEIASVPWEPSALYTLVLLYKDLIRRESGDNQLYQERINSLLTGLENEIINYSNEKEYKIFD